MTVFGNRKAPHATDVKFAKLTETGKIPGPRRYALGAMLLSHPAKSISDVATALGYRSANCFRLAFKKLTGLSPSAWRETLRMKPALPPAASVK